MEKGCNNERNPSNKPNSTGEKERLHDEFLSKDEKNGGAGEGVKNFRQNDLEKRGFGDIDEEITSVEEVQEVEETLMQQVQSLQKEKDELFARMQRLQADFDNYRKRSLGEQNRCVQYALAELFKSLVPVIDNFERALDSGEKGEGFVSGVEMIFKQLKEVLKKEGLEQIIAEGEVFDPYVHEAVMHVESEGHEENLVIEEFQKGYKFKDKLIRPSMVKVAK
ncbi:nucleotide exchange factor GrpE [Candidatus Contubernalis alkaliaceticus]|uniref:nucleotide exchange factor GrpE n=1 Tax=Candidatus Contubernalis alkaliaceticus TaxID=338645 RepID=UPI001F4BE893|nr:nucleotide exchange factor GrpE [Candidatus Contubernalis alkalaceticus]UNC93241.1 nucleotide exchange factor GrpE [Candidatus Contubernalis alkalaceticus]